MKFDVLLLFFDLNVSADACVGDKRIIIICNLACCAAAGRAWPMTE